MKASNRLKPFLLRVLPAVLLGGIMIGAVVSGCGGAGEEEHGGHAVENEPPDPNAEVRREHMSEIGQICGGISLAIRQGTVTGVKAEVEKLKELMAIVATMPPRYDASRYEFYASDFQIRAETLMVAIDTNAPGEIDSAFRELAVTCGVCHYNCGFSSEL